MAEAALLGVAKSVLQQLASPAFNEILLVWNSEKDLNSLHQTIQTITDFLHDAQLRESKERLVKGWLSRLRSVLYDADDLFDTVAARALRKKKVMSGNSFTKEVRLFFSKSNQLDFVVRTAHRVKDIKERLDAISRDMSQFNFMSKRIEENPTRVPDRKETHSFVRLEDVIGRDLEREELIELLLPKEETCQSSLSVIAVIGFGGLGKTTLAQFVYNDATVQGGFDLCLWACVNYFSDLKEALKTILTAVIGSKANDNSLDHLQREFRKRIEGKKYFLVLDDVWDEDTSNWRDLKKVLDCGKIGSKILATTRSTEVAQCLNAIKPYYQLNILSKERAWDLFAKSAFEEGEICNDSELVQLGEQIVRKCGYVPLALITVGSMLRFKEKDKKTWLSVLDNELAVLSDNKDDQIMKVLMISYNGLPHALKNCFAYCSIFPKDRVFCKDDLICLWIAQGFIEPHDMKSLEEVGDAYFFHLVDRCLFQEVKRSTLEGYPIYACKMHDLLHDLAKQVSGAESRSFTGGDLEGVGVGNSLRHIAAINYDPKFIFDPFVLSPHSNTLRTLALVVGGGHFKTSSMSLLLERFKMLRALWLSGNVDVLPDSFAGLIHLRYLDLSANEKLKEIPNSICKLQHLQTLDLRRCRSLVELPSKLGKLVSLRHLLLDGCSKLECLPSGLSEITTLVTLDRLTVHPSKGGLRYLGCLDNLWGCLKMDLPRKVWPNCIEDARKSNISKKHKLNGMNINWIGVGEQETAMKEIEGVLEAVRPHENLEYLSINGYGGDRLSSWVFSLSNLKELSLYGCTLEYLYHENVKFESLLPCLETLKMVSLHNLKGWWREAAIPVCDSSISASSMLSRVSKVFITDCPNLVEGMPLLKGIVELCLDKVNGKLVGKLLSTRTPNLKVLKLFEVEDLSCLPKGSIKFSTSLKSLNIERCKELRWVSCRGLAYLTALEELHIYQCGSVKLDDEDGDDENEEINNSSGLGMPWKALQRMRSLDMPWQRHLQEGLQYLTALKVLGMGYYEIKQVEEDNELVEKELHLHALQALDIRFYDKSCNCFPKWIQRLHFLKELYFRDCNELSVSWAMLANMNLQQLAFYRVEKVVNVDETETEQQIQFNSLIQLRIWGVKEGSWIHDIPWNIFQSLRSIKLYYIMNLKKIPDGFKHLTSLQNLKIFVMNAFYEREIKERCKPETGEDWHLISHIPTVKIEW